MNMKCRAVPLLAVGLAAALRRRGREMNKTLLVVAAIVVTGVVTTGCSSIAEKAFEEGLEQAVEGDEELEFDFDFDEGSFAMTDEDGNEAAIGAGESRWPENIPPPPGTPLEFQKQVDEYGFVVRDTRAIQGEFTEPYNEWLDALAADGFVIVESDETLGKVVSLEDATGDTAVWALFLGEEAEGGTLFAGMATGNIARPGDPTDIS